MSKLTDRRAECSSRPFHLWDAKAGKRIRSKFYADPKRAHWGALKEMRWAKVGTTLEVLDVRRGRELGAYTRGVNAIRFTTNGSKQ
jgi:hypothetical protein